MRVSYDIGHKQWKHLHGYVPEIQVKETVGDYYIWLQNRGWLLRFYNGERNGDQALGEILSADGITITDIPQYIPKKYKGLQRNFKCCFGWIIGENSDSIDMAIQCSNPADFRVRFNLDERIYVFLGFELR